MHSLKPPIRPRRKPDGGTAQLLAIKHDIAFARAQGFLYAPAVQIRLGGLLPRGQSLHRAICVHSTADVIHQHIASQTWTVADVLTAFEA